MLKTIIIGTTLTFSLNVFADVCLSSPWAQPDRFKASNAYVCAMPSQAIAVCTLSMNGGSGGGQPSVQLNQLKGSIVTFVGYECLLSYLQNNYHVKNYSGAACQACWMLENGVSPS